MDQPHNVPPVPNPTVPSGFIQLQTPPQTVHVVAKPSGFSRSITFMAGLLMFGFIFIVGILIGVMLMFGGGQFEDVVLRRVHRPGASARQSLAIIPVRGAIDDTSANFVRACVNHVLADDSIKGVVLRVDSPGGGVSASDQIWYEVKRLKDSGLPVVASFGGIAASGGYYVSCGTDHIYAEETCVTGSIGVIAQVFTMEQLMDKIGVEPVTLVASGSPDKDTANDIFRAWDDNDRAKLQVMLDAADDIFNRRVLDGRQALAGETFDLEAVADGSIFTAVQAVDNGLIDTIGYLSAAIDHAEKLARLRPGSANVFWLTEPPTLFPILGSVRAIGREERPVLDADQIRSTLNDLTAPKVMYLMR